MQEDRFHAGVRRVVITGLQIIFSGRGVLRVAGQDSVETEILFQVFEGDEDVDVANGGAWLTGAISTSYVSKNAAIRW